MIRRPGSPARALENRLTRALQGFRSMKLVTLDDVRHAASGSDNAAPPPAFDLFGLAGDTPHERVVFASDPVTGLQAIVALYSTTRGPAFGGCRYWAYDNQASALHDALRLSQGMALKNALSDLPYGGGKAVMLKHASQTDRSALFRSFGAFVASLDGRYLTAEDVGTTAEDMFAVRETTRFVSGMPRDGEFGGNPSPQTALGVFVGIEAAVRRVLGKRALESVSVAVQGLGSVGWNLCEQLHAAGATLIVADIDAGKVARAIDLFGATGVSIDAITGVDADVFAPCAMGGSITPTVAANCRFRIVAGGANNQLVSLADGDALHRRDVFYVPDFLINAGGIISCVREYEGNATRDAVIAEVTRIGERVSELYDRALASAQPTARIADAWAKDKLVV